MDFSLSDEERAIRDTARDFITKEVMPLEQELLRRERAHRPGLERAELRERPGSDVHAGGSGHRDLQQHRRRL